MLDTIIIWFSLLDSTRLKSKLFPNSPYISLHEEFCFQHLQLRLVVKRCVWTFYIRSWLKALLFIAIIPTAKEPIIQCSGVCSFVDIVGQEYYVYIYLRFSYTFLDTLWFLHKQSKQQMVCICPLIMRSAKPNETHWATAQQWALCLQQKDWHFGSSCLHWPVV